jgi:DME family drug/metabolite transporter
VTAGPGWRGGLAIAAAATAWGTGGTLAVILNHSAGLGPFAVTFWRFAIAVLLLGTIRLFRRARTEPTVPEARWWVRWRPAAVTGAGLALYQSAYFASVDNAGVALGTLVTLGGGPVLIAVGARYLLGEALTRRHIVAIAVATTGLALLTAGPGVAGPHPLVGIGFALLSAAGYAVLTLYTRTGKGQGATLPVFLGGLVCLAPTAIGVRLLPPFDLAGPVGVAVLFLGAVPTVLAYRWYFAGLRTTPAATAAMIVLLEPITAAALAVGVLHERLTAPTIVGSVLLLATVVVMARPSRAEVLATTG